MENQFNYDYLWEYLPKRYTPTAQQQAHRNSIYRFKDGSCDSDVKNFLINRINQITNGNASRYIVGFIPASTKQKTIDRYSSLAQYIKDGTHCAVDIMLISTTKDIEAGHISGKTSNPTEYFAYRQLEFQNRKVILIDDIITRGTTFNSTCQSLIRLGAESVTGLFVAKTINPDWHGRSMSYFDESLDQMEEFDFNDYINAEMYNQFEPDEEALLEQRMRDYEEQGF